MFYLKLNWAHTGLDRYHSTRTRTTTLNIEGENLPAVVSLPDMHCYIVPYLVSFQDNGVRRRLCTLVVVALDNGTYPALPHAGAGW